MKPATQRFPDYGDDGDLAGAHRGRRAFRLCVAAVVLLTGFMYFSERFLRHSQPETLYLRGITLNRDSSRVLLQSAIRADEELGETPTAKYIQALAVRQEDDIALETYAKAWELDPMNSFFALRYGCRLYLLGQPGAAADKFSAARALPPANGLPRYLEAAAIARAGGDMDSLGEAMVVVSRTNNARESILFPKPLWYSGYPERGTQYARLSREIVDESCAPLYQLSQQVVSAVHEQLSANQTQHAKTWLEQIHRMGRRLVEDSEPKGTLQAMAGITIQQQATQMLAELQAREGRDAGESLIETRVKLDGALGPLKDFENARSERLQRIEQEYMYPLQLAGMGIALLLGAYLLALTAHKMLRLRKSAWALPHSALGKWILGIGIATLFLLLQFLTALQKIADAQDEYARAVVTIWWGVMGILIVFGWLYPALTLSTPEEVSRKSGRLEEMPDTIRLARQAYRRVYAAMVVRYYGILSGLAMCMICVWVISYRILNGLYPWQVNLLSDGLLEEEYRIVEQVLAMLG